MNKKAKVGTVKVEVWGDFMCPFCYIAKRQFETALAQFSQRDSVELVWKSFQLQDNALIEKPMNAIEFVAQSKKIPLLLARKALNGIAERAQSAGLHFDFTKTIVANTMDAHRLRHFAQTQGKGRELEEALYDGYFVSGINLGDRSALVQLAVRHGLAAEPTRVALDSGAYGEFVQKGMAEATQIGVKGVPYYLFNLTDELVGQQSVEVYLQALELAYAKSVDELEHDELTGGFCGIDRDCA